MCANCARLFTFVRNRSAPPYISLIGTTDGYHTRYKFSLCARHKNTRQRKERDRTRSCLPLGYPATIFGLRAHPPGKGRGSRPPPHGTRGLHAWAASKWHKRAPSTAAGSLVSPRQGPGAGSERAWPHRRSFPEQPGVFRCPVEQASLAVRPVTSSPPSHPSHQ